jgi:hypothetical protein
VKVIKSKIPGGGQGLLYHNSNDQGEDEMLLCVIQGNLKHVSNLSNQKDRRYVNIKLVLSKFTSPFIYLVFTYFHLYFTDIYLILTYFHLYFTDIYLILTYFHLYFTDIYQEFTNIHLLFTDIYHKNNFFYI